MSDEEAAIRAKALRIQALLKEVDPELNYAFFLFTKRGGKMAMMSNCTKASVRTALLQFCKDEALGN